MIAAEHPTSILHLSEPVEQVPALLGILAMLRRRKGLLVFGLLIGLGAGALYYFQAKRIYRSEVLILVERKDANLAAGGTEGSDFERNAMNEDLLSTQMEILRSRRVVTDAIEAHGLATLPSIVAEKKKDQDAADYIIDQLSVTRGGEGQAKTAHVLCARFECTSRPDADQVLGAIVESYRKFLGDTFQVTSQEAVKLIGEAEDHLKNELQAAEDAYQTFCLASPLLVNDDSTTNLAQESLKTIDKKLTESRLAYAETKARLAVIDEQLSRPEASEYTNADLLALLSKDEAVRIGYMVDATRQDLTSDRLTREIPLLTETHRAEKSTLLTLELKLTELLQKYGPGHPQVKDTRAEIERAREILDEGKSGVTATVRTEKLTPAELLRAFQESLRHDLADLEKRIADLDQQAEEQREIAKELSGYMVRANTLKSDVERKQKIYDVVLERLRDINLVKDYGGYLTEVISPVQSAQKFVSPILWLTLSLGGVGGLCIGFGLAYLVDFADRTFRSPEEVRRTLRLPLLGHVPALPGPPKNGKRMHATNGDAASSIDRSVVTYHYPQSWEAEAFRGLRTSVTFAGRGASHQVIQITSPNPGDGKTTITANLAVAMAQAGKRVLLVDCDLRNPRVHKLFGLNNTLGLADCLTGDAEPFDAIHSTEVEKLWVMPRGALPPNPSELLTSECFVQLLQTVRQQYDCVLLDSPPVLAVSDPCIVAPRADGVLLAIKTSKNGIVPAVRAREMLASLEAHLIGVVVNRCEGRPSDEYGRHVTGVYGYVYGKEYYSEKANDKAPVTSK
jgi:succinoglycan biosynthesis transport protein ExoP